MLTALKMMVRSLQGRREVTTLRDLDEAALRDIGLTRMDVSVALNAPLLRNPSEMLRRVCCDAFRSIRTAPMACC